MIVTVGMSGGVDSSVAAYLLKKAGCDVIGVFMKNWEEDSPVCPAQQDFEDAKSVCLKLNIPFFAVNFSQSYYDGVFKHFLREYELGRTPNPDIACNNIIKFGVFADYVRRNFNSAAVATGHYAKVYNRFSPNGIFLPETLEQKDSFNTSARLFKPADLNKDQTYFLSGLSTEQLSDAIFPLSDITKPEVREIAQNLGLRTAKKKDSTGICFIGERNFRNFLKDYLPGKNGPMIDMDTGKEMGEHVGLMHYTIGQRRGLNIGGAGTGERWFVVEKDLTDNILYVVQGENNPKNFSDGFISNEVNLINPLSKELLIKDENGESELSCGIKYRYRQNEVKAKICFNQDFTACRVSFETPQKGVAPGQSGVFYLNGECLGSAIIDKSFRQIQARGQGVQ